MISKPIPQRTSASALDDRLSGPEGAAVKKEYLTKLENHWSKILQSKRKGDLNPTEYQITECMGDAILQAMVILKNYRKLDEIGKK